jgi:hypothetical protein
MLDGWVGIGFGRSWRVAPHGATVLTPVITVDSAVFFEPLRRNGGEWQVPAVWRFARLRFQYEWPPSEYIHAGSDGLWTDRYSNILGVMGPRWSR